MNFLGPVNFPHRFLSRYAGNAKIIEAITHIVQPSSVMRLLYNALPGGVDRKLLANSTCILETVAIRMKPVVAEIYLL